MPSHCIICGSSKNSDPNLSLYRIPKQTDLRRSWLRGLQLSEEDLTKDARVCSKHFRDGNSKTIPSIFIGERFAYRAPVDSSRGKRRASREARKEVQSQEINTERPTSTPSSSLNSPPSITPDRSVCESITSNSSLITSDSSSVFSAGPSASTALSPVAGLQVTVNVALVSQIEMLQGENRKLRAQLQSFKKPPFSVESIANSNSLISLYTGLPSYEVFLCLFELLGPAVDNLHYWGTKKRSTRKRRMKLSPMNQLFLTLVKLKY